MYFLTGILFPFILAIKIHIFELSFSSNECRLCAMTKYNCPLFLSHFGVELVDLYNCFNKVALGHLSFFSVAFLGIWKSV